jgi:hypothetical protein
VSSHRAHVRPRYGRIAALATSVTVSVVAALAGLGVLATGSSPADAARPAAYTPSATVSTGAANAAATGEIDGTGDTGDTSDTGDTGGQPTSSSTGPALPAEQSGSGQETSHSAIESPTALPAASGSGRRIVFSQSRQRVWLMGQQPDEVQRTYLVSGSVTHNLQPGTYSVYSRSRWAVGVDDSGVMQYFVRFTQGPTGAAIGFHTIPTKNGVPLQSKAQLGTAESHGCIRQDLPDAVALWNFAPVGTKVVVVA